MSIVSPWWFRWNEPWSKTQRERETDWADDVKKLCHVWKVKRACDTIKVCSFAAWWDEFHWLFMAHSLRQMMSSNKGNEAEEEEIWNFSCRIFFAKRYNSRTFSFGKFPEIFASVGNRHRKKRYQNKHKLRTLLLFEYIRCYMIRVNGEGMRERERKEERTSECGSEKERDIESRTCRK